MTSRFITSRTFMLLVLVTQRYTTYTKFTANIQTPARSMFSDSLDSVFDLFPRLKIESVRYHVVIYHLHQTQSYHSGKQFKVQYCLESCDYEIRRDNS